ncbi:unnamed protein product [Ectocarpus sp. 13 AM-2016]
MPPDMSAVSGDLMRAETIAIGSDIWTDDEEGEVWTIAEVVHQENTMLTVRYKSTGEEHKIDLVKRSIMRHSLELLKPAQQKPSVSDHKLLLQLQSAEFAGEPPMVPFVTRNYNLLPSVLCV